jgi:hypothetical protein
MMTQYEYDVRPNTAVTVRGREEIAKILKGKYSVLVGPNNCGKSFLLKTLTQEVGERAAYLGPARYQNFHLLGFYTPNRRDRKRERFDRFVAQWQNQQQNIDSSPLNLQQSHCRTFQRRTQHTARNRASSVKRRTRNSQYSPKQFDVSEIHQLQWTQHLVH